MYREYVIYASFGSNRRALALHVYLSHLLLWHRLTAAFGRTAERARKNGCENCNMQALVLIICAMASIHSPTRSFSNTALLPVPRARATSKPLTSLHLCWNEGGGKSACGRGTRYAEIIYIISGTGSKAVAVAERAWLRDCIIRNYKVQSKLMLTDDLIYCTVTSARCPRN